MASHITYVRHFGKPDLFIHMQSRVESDKTNLLEGQNPNDRHDIIARVFKLKGESMLKIINKGEIFGPTRSHMMSYE